MKKISILLLIMIMSVCFISCGKKNGEQETADNNMNTEMVMQEEKSSEEAIAEFDKVVDTEASNNQKNEDTKSDEIELVETERKDLNEEETQTPARPPVEPAPTDTPIETPTEAPVETPTEAPETSTDKNLDAPIELPFVPAP